MRRSAPLCSTRDQATRTRDELFARAMPLVQRLVWSRVRWWPPSVDVDDMLAAAYERVLRHVERYDPARGTFDIFVIVHVRGALRDQRRLDDRLTRNGRKQINKIARATHQLRHELGRAPEEDEVARRMGISLDALLSVSSFSAEIDEAEVDNPAPDARVLERERLQPLTEAMGRLVPRKRWVVEQYYWHGRRQLDIATELGVTESRVCQMLREALESLRGAFDRGEARSSAIGHVAAAAAVAASSTRSPIHSGHGAERLH